MGDPWASYDGELGDVPGVLGPEELGYGPGELGEANMLLSADSRHVEREARRAQRKRDAERAERADLRERMVYLAGQQWAAALHQPFDPQNPFQHIPSVQARAEMMEARHLMAMRKQAQKLLRDADLPVSLLRPPELPGLPPDTPVLPEPGPSAEEKADAELARARRRTEHAGMVAKIRRTLRRGSAATRSAPVELEYTHREVRVR
jgi:hypothetical protein